KIHDGDVRVTGNSKLIIGRVRPDNVAAIDAIVQEYGRDLYEGLRPQRRNAMTRVAIPPCGHAIAEAERYIPDPRNNLEPLHGKHGLADDDFLLRMTGCRNACARPYLAEIALVGKAPGRYNLFLGGGLTGERLNELYAQNLPEQEILN